MNLQSISRYISLILRHKPEVIGITIDEYGWANSICQDIKDSRSFI